MANTTESDIFHVAPACEELGIEHRRALEAMIMVCEEPVEPSLLAELLGCTVDQVDAACVDIQRSYVEEERGFELVAVGGGWRYQACGDLSSYVEQFVLSGQTARLSAAALETLAIVAYKQPISRAQMTAIRGVNVDGVIRTLVQRGYVEEQIKDDGPGQASLFGTTRVFLERLGINSVSELAPLEAFVPDNEIVEALEQGLRVEPTVEPLAEPTVETDSSQEEATEIVILQTTHVETAPPETAPPETAPTETVIDLTHAATTVGDEPEPKALSDEPG